ncbi:MAG: DUF6361 family protein [Chitinophagales bacterium]
MAEIGWIDFSVNDRKKMKQAMSLIRPEGQLDELGMGRIRDGIANLLFPGLSTIHTRAKYFFIVPYIFRDFLYLPLKEKNKITAARYLEERQHEVKNNLRAKYEGQSNTGIIGITLSEKQKSVRQPAEIYWVGINTFECLNAGGLSMSALLKNIQHIDFGAASQSNTEELDDDRDAGIDINHNIRIPAAPRNWKETIDIKLTQLEADFLENAFSDVHNPTLQNSVLQRVFHHNGLMQCLLNAKNFAEFAKVAYNLPNIENELRQNLILAHDFAYIIDGAHIIYNHLLQLHFFPKEYEGEHLTAWALWYENLPAALIDFNGFQIQDLNDWISDARYFVSNWWEMVNKQVPYKQLNMDAMFSLIRNRELSVKGRKARLHNSIQSYYEMQPMKWIGLRPLQYRFANAKRIIEDIKNPIQDA